MTEEQTALRVMLGELFNQGCHYAGFGAHSFTAPERDAFLTNLTQFFEDRQAAINPLWLTRQLLRTEGKFDSAQDRALAIVGGK